jgi:predicted PurR-regulated permease PerM
MAKKKKKKKPVPPEVKLRRRIKKYTRRALTIIALATLYFSVLPVLVPSLAPQVNQTKQSLISVASQARGQISQILTTASSITAQFTSKKGEIEEKGAEALVQESVDDLTERVKQLPREQVKKVKRQFCSDLIQEAVLSATESGEKEE